MPAYASAAIDEFYDYDIDTLYARIDARISGTISTADLETLADQAHETAMPAKKTKQGHSYSEERGIKIITLEYACLLYTSPSPRDGLLSRMPSSA